MKKMPSFAATSLLTVALLPLLYSCSENVLSPSTGATNLVQNSSFEVNNQPSLQGWSGDTGSAPFQQDAPTNGGTWSLLLGPGWVPVEGFARTYITGLSGTGVYRLSGWMKSMYEWEGSMSLLVKSQGVWTTRKTVRMAPPQWMQVSITDTLSLHPSDSLAIHLSAGWAEAEVGVVLFDLIVLERLQ